MIIPNPELAIVTEEKLKHYLLSDTHPIGKFKAVFFNSLGYNESNWQLPEQAIRSTLTNDIAASEKTEFGEKYQIFGRIDGPKSSANVATVWMVKNNEDFPRFITAYPGG